jgi:hypothetical protein
MELYDSFNFGTSMNTPYLSSAIIFIAYTMGGNTLKASKVFPALFLL